jgi:hypothetical protein
MTEQEIINRGSDAEQFKRYMEENPYFTSVIALSKQLLWQNICDLRPDEQMKFTVLKAQQDAIEELMNLVEIDIYEGQKAISRMQTPEHGDEVYQKGDVL